MPLRSGVLVAESITGKDWQKKDLQRKYQGMFSWYLQQKIDSLSSMTDLQQQFGQIDIYLFDQLLRGRIAPGMRILDAGCGHGRNLVYLLREGYQVFGVDTDPRRLKRCVTWLDRLRPLFRRTTFAWRPSKPCPSRTLSPTWR